MPYGSLVILSTLSLHSEAKWRLSITLIQFLPQLVHVLKLLLILIYVLSDSQLECLIQECVDPLLVVILAHLDRVVDKRIDAKDMLHRCPADWVHRDGLTICISYDATHLCLIFIKASDELLRS